ncbi:VirK/YbjX family protein [Acinetobacter sp.]|uniref:VirK/YbjX family protein n=1 Tax=Acinetobacter sp. TaxID=472 RepID=UPI002FDB503F
MKYFKYILRFFINWRESYIWVAYLNSTPQLIKWKENYKEDLYLKLQSAYLSNNFDNQQKIKNLKAHYDWFFSQIDESHSMQTEINLWKYILESENKDELCLSLLFKSYFCKEGESSLILRLNDSIQYILTFSYISLNGKPAFFIGGLQGGRQEDTNPELIKQLTKNLYGLRPKQLMLHGLSVLCDFYNVKQVVGVSNENHFFKSSRRAKNRERVKTNLNEFWLEFDAELDEWNNFIFRPLSNQINLEEIPSKKRSQYRKRQLILDQLVEQGIMQLENLKYPKNLVYKKI